jgi:hypothetical protein
MFAHGACGNRRALSISANGKRGFALCPGFSSCTNTHATIAANTGRRMAARFHNCVIAAAWRPKERLSNQ